MKEIQKFAVSIQTDSAASTARYTSLLHALDYTRRMLRLVLYNLNDVKLTNPSERIYPIVFQLEEMIVESMEALEKDQIEFILPKLADFSQQLAKFRRKERAGIFKYTARGEVHINEAFDYVKLVLLVDGIAYHLWRMMHDLSEKDLEA